MKRHLVLAVYLVLLGTMVVQAGTISVTSTRESYNSELDKLTITITDFGDGVASGSEMTGFEGTWMAEGGDSAALRLTSDTGDEWYGYTRNLFADVMETLGGGVFFLVRQFR